jgi:hypothetical protein
MWKQASKKAGPVIAGAIVLETKRQQENKEKNMYADKQTNEAGETIKGFEYPHEREAFHKARREDWIQENGLVTKSLRFLEDLWKSSG